MTYQNAAFYKFTRIDDPEALRASLLASSETWGLRGTILLAHEGLNACIAGEEDSLGAFLAELRSDPRFLDIAPKLSASDTLPFRRMLVKVKREIVTMGQDDIDPAHFTGRYVAPLELEAWLDEGRDIVLVDTRNGYEVRLGTFKGAVDPGIASFRTFPSWVDSNLADKKGARVVTFCTGGIRCEKATAWMRKNGFDDVWQLEGGILKYLEDTAARGGSRHFKGDCFVFDYRVAVDGRLRPADYALCYACRAPLSVADRASPHYVYEKQCPYCVGATESKETKRALRRREKERAFFARRRERAAGRRAARAGVQSGSSQPKEEP